jgi:hypothetical protein
MKPPRAERSLDWIRIAARFPVRIQVDDPVGASAGDTVRGTFRSPDR